MAQRKEKISVRVSTIRALRNAVHLINDDFRFDVENCRLFLSILKSPYTVVTQLTRMRRYGILGRYLPAFGNIVGQMQHDLFHIYTVDAHTMMVIAHATLCYEHALKPSHCTPLRVFPRASCSILPACFMTSVKAEGGSF